MMPLIVLFGAQISDDYVEWLITSVKVEKWKLIFEFSYVFLQ